MKMNPAKSQTPRPKLTPLPLDCLSGWPKPASTKRPSVDDPIAPKSYLPLLPPPMLQFSEEHLEVTIGGTVRRVRLFSDRDLNFDGAVGMVEGPHTQAELTSKDRIEQLEREVK